MLDADAILQKLNDFADRLEKVLALIESPAVRTTKKLLTVADVVAEYSLSAASVYRLPAYCLARAGRSVRVRRDALERYLARTDP